MLGARQRLHAECHGCRLPQYSACRHRSQPQPRKFWTKPWLLRGELAVSREGGREGERVGACFDFRKKEGVYPQKAKQWLSYSTLKYYGPHTFTDSHTSTHTLIHTSKQAVIIWACVPILACVCLFILMSVYFICVCCCCCFGERKKRSNRPKIVCGVLTSIMIVFCLWVQSFSPSITIHLGACSWCTTLWVQVAWHRSYSYFWFSDWSCPVLCVVEVHCVLGDESST